MKRVQDAFVKLFFTTIYMSLKFSVYLIILLIIIKVSFMAYDFGYHIFYEKNMIGTNEFMTVEIKEDSSLEDIGRSLYKKGLIDNEIQFFIQAKFFSYKVKAGQYEVEKGISTKEVIHTLNTVIDKKE